MKWPGIMKLLLYRYFITANLFISQTNISFIENSSKLKGAAIYVSSLRRCVWTEEFPYYNASKALRWSSNFVYKNNSIIFDGGTEAFSGSEYDIATDTKSFHSSAENNSTVKVCIAC